MKIVVLGYGKIGKLLAKECIEQKLAFEIASNSEQLQQIKLNKDCIVIDFSNSEAFLHNLDIILNKQANLVVGTTGWQDYFDDVKQKVLAANISFCHGSNFSTSLYYFDKIVDFATKNLVKINDINVNIKESHHIHKKDSPSGTAITLCNNIAKYYYQPIDIKSIREGEIIGEHIINFNSLNEDIILTHSAKSKLLYAKGALLCAKYIYENKGFFNVKEVFDSVL